MNKRDFWTCDNFLVTNLSLKNFSLYISTLGHLNGTIFKYYHKFCPPVIHFLNLIHIVLQFHIRIVYLIIILKIKNIISMSHFYKKLSHGMSQPERII